ncbi:uncharacterized protein [Eurosta solidaginis]|uniref:uncharacterized protein n=1 Tax=Eurosta solidaginis TaxID=178769 RepID=UPI003530A4AE
MVRIRGLRCAVATDNHKLQQPVTYIKNQHLVEFVRKRRIDYRSEDPVCKKCAEELERIYLIKLARAKEKKREQAERSVEVSSVTDPDETHPPRPLTKSTSSTTASGTSAGNETQQLNTSESTLDEGPSTSAAAAVARKSREQALKRRHVVADDDDDYVPSPNVTNGTRLPHIQPIPKRRRFVHANPDVLNIYMAGLTGG